MRSDKNNAEQVVIPADAGIRLAKRPSSRAKRGNPEPLPDETGSPRPPASR